MEFQEPFLAGVAVAMIPGTILADSLAGRYTARHEKPDDALPLPDPDQAELINAEIKKTNMKKRLGALAVGVGIAFGLLQFSNPGTRGPEKVEQEGIVIAVGGVNNPPVIDEEINGAVDAARKTPARDRFVLDGSVAIDEAYWNSGPKTNEQVKKIDESIRNTLNPYSSIDFINQSTISNAVASLANQQNGPTNIIVVTGSNDGSDLADLRPVVNSLNSGDRVDVVAVDDPSSAQSYKQLGVSSVLQASNANQVQQMVEKDIDSTISKPPPIHPITWPKDVAFAAAGLLALAAVERRFNGVIQLAKFHKNKKEKK